MATLEERLNNFLTDDSNYNDIEGSMVYLNHGKLLAFFTEELKELRDEVQALADRYESDEISRVVSLINTKLE